MTVHPLTTKPRPETAAEGVRRLEAQARTAAHELSLGIQNDLVDLRDDCAEAAGIGTLLPGLREVYRKLAEQIDAGLTTISIVSARAQ